MRRPRTTSCKPANTQRRAATKPKRNNAPSARRSKQSTDLKEQASVLARELAQAREHLTATSDVLQVINSSPSDLQPAFDSILEDATRICQAKFGLLVLPEGDAFRVGAMHNVPDKLAELRRREPVFHANPLLMLTRAMNSKHLLHIPDLLDDVGYKERDPITVRFAKNGGCGRYSPCRSSRKIN